MFDFHLRLAFKADRLARSTSRISHAFVPVAHPALKAPPPFVFRIATRPWFRRGADTPNIPLSCRYHLYHDSRIPPTPSRLGHLAPPHVTSINRGGMTSQSSVYGPFPHTRGCTGCSRVSLQTIPSLLSLSKLQHLPITDLKFIESAMKSRAFALVTSESEMVWHSCIYRGLRA
ncbi:hypothetical protein BGY98DRAFT_142960 [Russula aff. rugulosa BPL654]|nr:hypothetical protein BGY98DRAFT_142960 [Russula aff. rugulosa BPL654]